MKILNLGCGTKFSNHPSVINIDWSIYLRLKSVRIVQPIVPLFIRGDRLEKYKSLPDNILVHNLAKGIPFESDSVDVVYHSHVLEHFDKNVAEDFLREAQRVLKPGGVQRIVVPDFEKACSAYLEHIAVSEATPSESKNHDSFIASVLEQSVRKESHKTSQQDTLQRFMENLILGDARKRGETHQWMYDRISLIAKLNALGYDKVFKQDYNTSLIPNWADYGLDVDENNNQYKKDSLYIEVVK